jgi:hypothetical protein
MATEVPTFDPITGLPRLPSHEATDASRGYLSGWAQAIDAILNGGDDDLVYVEAFEDVVAVAANGEIGGIQIKDKTGAFSVTQEEPCGMLERWASVVEQRPGSWFRFCSTQQPSNLFNRSDSFPRWVAGDKSAKVLNELRESLGKFVSGKHKGKFERIERLTQNHSAFKAYWECVEWRLGGLGFDELRKQLIEKIQQLIPGDIDHRTRELRLYAWIGAVAISAASENIDDRRWTKKRLLAIDPSNNKLVERFASLVDRLNAAEAQKQTALLSEILETVRLTAVRRSKPRPTLKPSKFVHAPRLEKAAMGVIEVLTQGKRLVALRGRPADGKSEAGRQLAVLVPEAYHIELSPSLDPPDAWRQALLRVAEALRAESDPDTKLDVLKATVRDLLAEEGASLLIVDNVDFEPPFPIQDLLLHDAASKCVCIGGGLKDCQAEVELESPSEANFLQIALEPFGGVDAIPEPCAELVKEIGTLSGESAICACAVWWQCDPTRLEDDLRDFRDALAKLGAATLEDRIRTAVLKCWSALDAVSRRRVRFIAALGEPEIPLPWLPEELRHGPPGAWRLLARSGVAPRGHNTEVETVRVHRIVASWADKEMEPHSVLDVATCLVRWSRDPALADELKARQSRLRALVHGFRVVTRHGFPPALSADELASLRRAYFDGCGHVGLEGTSLEQFIRDGLEGTTLALLPPVVLGQLLDSVPERLSRKPGFLANLHTEAAACLGKWVDENPPRESYVDDGQADEVDAYRHHAKQLYRSKRSEEAARLLHRVDQISSEGWRRSPNRRLWHLLQVKGRLQLATRSGGTDGRLEQELLEVLDRAEVVLPDYLRLAGLRCVVKAFSLIPLDALPAARRKALILEGLALCRLRRSHEIQQDFLQASVAGIEIAGLQELYPEVVRAADEVVASVSARGKLRSGIGFTLYRAASAGTARDSLPRMVEALNLIWQGRLVPDDFQKVRAGAVLRDAGRPELAEPILREVWNRQQGGTDPHPYWSGIELAKTLRWLNRCEEGIVIMEPLSQDPAFGTGAADELAKLLASINRFDEASLVLRNNAIAYEARNYIAFAERCRGWDEGIPNSVSKFHGLLGDYSKCHFRRTEAQADPDSLRELDDTLEKIASGLRGERPPANG